jgi:hypothetical protein
MTFPCTSKWFISHQKTNFQMAISVRQMQGRSTEAVIFTAMCL